MWQGVATDTVRSVGDLWSGSALQRYDIVMVDAPGVQGGQYFVWAVLFIIFLSLLLRRPFSVYFTWAGGFLKYPARRTFYDTSASVRLGLPVSLAISLPLSAFLVYGMGGVSAGYLTVLGVIAAYAASRLLITSGISYVSRGNAMVAASNRMACVFFTIAVLLFTVVYIIGMFIPDVLAVLGEKVVPAISAVLVLLYLVEQTRIIFSFKEPVFLSILYLCTLEILPIVLSVATILKF